MYFFLELFEKSSTFAVSKLQSELKTSTIMAKPIVDSPALQGRDAERFQERAGNVQPVSSAYMQRFNQDVTFLREHANFSL